MQSILVDKQITIPMRLGYEIDRKLLILWVGILEDRLARGPVIRVISEFTDYVDWREHVELKQGAYSLKG